MNRSSRAAVGVAFCSTYSLRSIILLYKKICPKPINYFRNFESVGYISYYIRSVGSRFVDRGIILVTWLSYHAFQALNLLLY